jgi:hypothetical protein
VKIKYIGGFLVMIAFSSVGFSLLNSARASSREDPVQALWDHTGKRSSSWTSAAASAIRAYGPNLISSVPADIADYCPAFASLETHQRVAFWVNLISTLALQESSFDAGSSYIEHFKDSSGNAVVSRGLLQLSLADGSIYGCGFDSASDLDDASRNLECGVIIMNRLVGKDHRIAGKVGGRFRGLSRYWGPFRDMGNIVLFQLSSKELEFCAK